jgi:hypothetical protein
MYDGLLKIDNGQFTIGQDIKENVYLPDGAITFLAVNKEKLSVKLQINDISISEYHRNNGFSKIAFKI